MAWTPPDVYKRALSAKSAAACEAARRPQCVCRCGGALHGIDHTEFIDRIDAELESTGEIERDECFRIAEVLASKSRRRAVATNSKAAKKKGGKRK